MRIDEFRKQSSRARLPNTVFPEPFLLKKTKGQIIDDLLAVLNKKVLTVHHSLNLLE